MAELEAAFPGARRALFSRYHLGGCNTCAYSPTETVAQLCARHDHLPVEEMLAHVEASHENDLQMQLSPSEVAAALRGPEPPRLLDLRTREEFEAVHISGSELMTEALHSQLIAEGTESDFLVLIDHTGPQALDAVAFLVGHGLRGAKALAGGIDAWSREVDPSLPRYRIELEEG